MNLSRIAPIALCFLGAAAFAESAPNVPPVAPAPPAEKPQGPPPGMQQQGPHIQTEIHLVTLDATGSLDAASQKTLDELGAEGWRPTNMSTVSQSPVTLAILFVKSTMPQRPMMPPRPPQAQPQGGPAPVSVQPAPLAPAPAPSAPAPTPAPAPTAAPTPTPAPVPAK